MMRITMHAVNGSQVFVLEGKLTRAWAQELVRVTTETNEGIGAIFDLREIFYVDLDGEEALQLLSGMGARFIAESAYSKDLCNRLHLHRVSPPEDESGDAKRTEDAPARVSRPNDVIRPASRIGVVATVHPSGSGR